MKSNGNVLRKILHECLFINSFAFLVFTIIIGLLENKIKKMKNEKFNSYILSTVIEAFRQNFHQKDSQ